MIIELAGASGIGKTTCLNKVAELLHSEYQVLSGPLLLEQMKTIREQHPNLHFSQAADHQLVFLYKDFVSEYLRRISQMTSHDSQKISLLRFIDTHRQDYLIRKEIQGHHLLVDEGLVHASFPLSQFSKNLAADVDFFISNIPLPDLVIQFRASPDQLFKRIKARGKVVNSYRYATDEQLKQRLTQVDHYLDIMAQVLHRRGCRVVILDANGPIAEWSQKLVKIVAQKVSHDSQQLPQECSLHLNFTSSSECTSDVSAFDVGSSNLLPDHPLRLNF